MTKKVIKKILKQKCYCNKKEGCKACNYTGYYKENYYYFIDPKTKIAYDSDTLS